jgi:hypothetical protein
MLSILCCPCHTMFILLLALCGWKNSLCLTINPLMAMESVMKNMAWHQLLAWNVESCENVLETFANFIHESLMTHFKSKISRVVEEFLRVVFKFICFIWPKRSAVHTMNQIRISGFMYITDPGYRDTENSRTMLLQFCLLFMVFVGSIWKLRGSAAWCFRWMLLSPLRQGRFR